ncbi:M56 family metallopeptidase [Flavobacterium facile]|uniref:M56 family metallopeptidase n=1 Tax=Flavobacterium facile TaxID=2893174 RepID=UPI002E76EEBA|nr:M56 family metallopeptidase [Flavobacterium sp. T-12]
METVFIYILKVNALFVLFYLVYQLALSRETFYKHSRWFLLSGLFVSLVLPFVTFTKIEYYEVKEVLSNSIENNVPQMVQISNEIVQEPILTNQEILFLVYGIICFGFLIKTVFDFFKLFKIIKVSNSEKKDKLVYINSNLVKTPFSFFNYIVFNSELINPIELQNIIKHEEAHSMQKHSFDTLLAQFFIILFWFNPIVWLYRKSIVQNLEFLADSFAIQQVSDKEYYQKTMLKITTQSSNITIINTFNQSSIKKRIIMLNTNQSKRKNIWKYILVVPLLTGFMLLFQIETIAQEKKSKEQTKKATESFLYVFEKQYDDSTIENYVKEIDKNHHLTLVITDVKRNSENEITAINVTIKTKEGQKINHIVHGDSPIGKFAIKIAKNNGNETVEILDKEELLYPNGTKRMKGKIDSVTVVVEDEINSEKTIVKSGDWKQVDAILNQAKSTKVSKKNEKDPLFIVNGKEMRRSEIVHKSIITDGETTIYNEKEGLEKFGEKGKDGVYVLNGKTTFTDDPKLLKAVPENPEKKYFELANGDGCVLINGYMLKIPSYPSINLNDSKNKIFINDKQFHKDMFYNYEHKNLKSVNVLKMFKDDVQVGYSIYFTTK